MDAADLGWSDFAIAMAGAAAALAGLIIVAMSVNIERILKSRSVPARAASAIAGLTAALVCGCLLLIPGQPVALLGAEVLFAAAVQWALWGLVLFDVRRDAEPGRPVFARAGIPFLPPALFTVSGFVLVTGSTAGLIWLAAAAVLSIVAGVIFAWIALVEILR